MQAPRHAPLIVLLLVAAGAAGFGVFQWMNRGTPGPQADNAAAMPAASKTMTAEEALNLKMDSLDGSGSRKLADWKGKAVLLNFWATWCAPCRQEIPLLVRLQAQYAAEGLQVVGIATDETDEKSVQAFLKRMVVNYPMLMGTDEVGNMVSGFGGTLIGLPYTLVLDRSGKVLTIHAGELQADEAEKLVELALHGQPAAAPAPGTSPAPAGISRVATTVK
ncbi:MAG TPA: TlpA disulfide reductase family protein [Gammaproteobacteria bacterium]|nr:TlpA disulfide reductase family protein [Gammaproteobacteria bacterium]